MSHVASIEGQEGDSYLLKEQKEFYENIKANNKQLESKYPDKSKVEIQALDAEHWYMSLVPSQNQMEIYEQRVNNWSI